MIAEMRRVTDEFTDRVLIGEIYLPLERLVAYYGRDLSGVHLPFNFSLLSTSWRAPPSLDSSTNTKSLSPQVAGPIGYSATMTRRGSRAAWGTIRRRSQLCCCSPCEALRRSIMETRSE